jgi:hypothetical protein
LHGRFNRRSRDVERFGISISVLSLVIARERSETRIVGKLSRDVYDPAQRELEFRIFRGRTESSGSDPPYGIVDLDAELQGAEIYAPTTEEEWGSLAAARTCSRLFVVSILSVAD